MAVIGLRGKGLMATLQSFNKIGKMALAGVMSISLLMQPILVQAQGVTADPNAGANNTPTIGAAPNGVPLVDIATPNGAGLSHNKYHDFNVANPGLILNNHNGEVGTSQLGGVVPGNPNLRQSGSASVILNEVTSGNRTALEGPTEVFGRKADVIIANPNGITCNGCGFINTPRATLTTGIPQIGLDGSLAGFDVRGGDVTIGERGANLASGKGSVDIFDIVSRTVHLDGAVAGHDIGITAGTGKFDYASREMKELYDIAGKPEYAIDGSALGALQGDRIKLIATEKGVGVRMRNDMAANAGQLTLSADGKISINNASGRDGVKVASRSKTVTAKKITSKKNVEIKANEGITIETIGADGDLMVDSGAGLLSVEGDAIAGGKLGFKSGDTIKAGQVAAGGDMDIQSTNGIDVLVAIADGQADLQTANGDINAKNGIKAGGGDLTITANKGSINSATLISFNNMTLQAGQDLNVAGNIMAQGNITATIAGYAKAANYAAGVDMAATDKNGSLTLGKQGSVNIKTGTGSIKSNNIYANNDVALESGNGVDVAGTILSQQGSAAITAKAGQSKSVKFDRLMANGTARINTNDLTFNSLLSGGDIALDVATLNAGMILSGMDMEASQKSATGDIYLKNDGRLVINASNAINAKQLLSAGNMVLHAANNVTYDDLTAYGNADITSDKGVISLQNATRAAGNITLTATALDLSNNRAKIQTARTLTLNANDINVSNSQLTFGGITLNGKNGLNAQNVSLNAITKNGGSGNISLTLPSFVADEKTNIRAENDLLINTASVDNNGLIASGNDLKLNVSNTLTNHQKGLIYSGRDGYIYVDGAVNNDYGAIMSGRDLAFANRAGNGRTASIVNKAGLIQSGNNLAILTSYLRNEANVDAAWATKQEYGNRIGFNRPDKNNELTNNGTSDMRGRLFYDPKGNNGHTWGAGGCRDDCDVTWLNAGMWDSIEQTYGDLTVDGKTFKAFTWNEAGHNSKKGKVWYDFNYNAYMQQQNDVQYFTSKPTIQGMIQSKGDMTIDATTIDNSYSNIEAAGKASITADTVNNKGVTLYRTKYMYCGAGDTCYVYDAKGNKTGEAIGNGQSGYIGTEAVDSANSLIKAGGSLTMNVKNLNNTAAEGSIAGSAHFEEKPATGNPMDALNNMTAGGALFTPKVDINSPNFTTSSLSAPKPNSGGFGGTLPNQNFIYETRADFLDVGKFYGSGYYLNRIGYKPDKQIIFLGDAYFENQLIDKQMRDLVGQGLGKGSFIPGNDPIEQMKALLDAGADYAQKNGLAFGEPLSPEQVASLDTSVVLYVKQNVNGVDVFAPVLYVAAKDKASVVSSGAKIEGGSVNITTDNLTHSGLIASNSSLKLEGTDILSNGGGFAAKGDLILASTGNIKLNAATSSRNGQTVINKTQAIDAGGTAIIQADKNVDLKGVDVKAGGSLGLYGENVNVGAAKSTTNGSENVRGSNIEAGKDLQVKADKDINVEGSRVHADGQLAMSADNGNLTIQSSNSTTKTGMGTNTLQQGSEVSSGGSMSLSADKNLTIAGSKVDSGGSLGIKAGENVAIIATQEKETGSFSSNTFDSTKQVGSSVSAANNMSIESGKDVLIGASDLKAGGNVGVQAQGDISVIAMANQANSRTDGSIVQGESHSTTTVGSSITAGGNVTAIAGQDGKEHNLNIVGSDIDAGGKVGLKTTGNVNILASQDTHQSQYHTEEDGGTFGGGKHSSDKSSYGNSLNGSSIHGDEGVNIQSGGDTTVFASDITAGQMDVRSDNASKGADINIQAGGNITVAAGQDVESSSSHSKSSGFLKKTAKEKDTYDETTVASHIGATGNVNMDAGGAATIAGSNVSAGQDINIAADSVNIIGVNETHTSHEEKRATGLGVGSYGDKGDGGKPGKQGYVSIWGKTSQTKDEASTKNFGSTVEAGGNVNLTARQTDINVFGSDVKAGNDINMDAARDVNIVSVAQDSSSLEEKKASGFGIGWSTNGASQASAKIGYKNDLDRTTKDGVKNDSSNINAGNNVNINAGNNINLVGSGIRGENDVNLKATNDVNMISAMDTTNVETIQKHLWVGVGVEVSSGIAGVAQNVKNAVKGVENVKDINSGLTGFNGVAGVYGDAKGILSGADQITHPNQKGSDFGDAINLAKVGVSVGFEASKSKNTTSTSTAVTPTVSAGHSISIEAEKGDIYGQGVQIEAGYDEHGMMGDQTKEGTGDINLKAGQDIYLESAKQTDKSKNSSQSFGASAGMELGLDLGMNVTGSANAKASYEQSKGNSQMTTNVNSHVKGTGDINIESGKDTTLKGAVVEGNKVTANIGGDLNIETQLDEGRSKQNGFSIGIEANSKVLFNGQEKDKFGTAWDAMNNGNWQLDGGAATVKGSYQNAHSSYAGAQEQSGIKAGDGGFNVTVKGNTDLKGGIIDSKADSSKNSLTTGTITTSDLDIHSDSSGVTIGGGFSDPYGEMKSKNDKGELNKPSKPGVSIDMPVHSSSNDEGKISSAVAPGTITITNPDEQKQDVAGINRDTSNTLDELPAMKNAKALLDEQKAKQQSYNDLKDNVNNAIGNALTMANDATKLLPPGKFKTDSEAFWNADDGKGAQAARIIGDALLAGTDPSNALKNFLGIEGARLLAPQLDVIVGGFVENLGIKDPDLAASMTAEITKTILTEMGVSMGTDYAGRYGNDRYRANGVDIGKKPDDKAATGNGKK
ncbi:Filamentous haemagglutinin FhaB/tRNA nuclease CdiA-like [Bartonella choladocola]|uniref:hemagglutinin repeat-containing protein n=1 Tax=Bartonella choladocola TaxID=2750995 RepID=UPI00399743B8